MSWLFSDWRWAEQPRVWMLWLVIGFGGALAALEFMGRDALGRFLSPLMQRRLVTRPSQGRTIARLVLAAVALAACIGALMRPRSPGAGETVTTGSSAADVMVVLDVSKSMLAEDVKPNRLKRAKTEIESMVRKLPGQRAGLVAFAGRAVLLCPLTPDQAFFNLVLRGVDTRSVSRGGTRIGEAIRTAVKAFPAGPGAKLVVLITDGEDHDSYPLDAAKEARKAGVEIIAVGLGSQDGSPIIITDPKTNAQTQMMHDGVPVISKLDGKTLAQMALATGGAYIPAGTSALDLQSIVKNNITPILRAEADAATRTIPAERYSYMVLIAMLAMLAAVAVGSSAGRMS